MDPDPHDAVGPPPQGSSTPGVAAPHEPTHAAAATAATAATAAVGSKASYMLPPGFPMPHTNVKPTCMVLKQLEDEQAAKAKIRAAVAAAAATAAATSARQSNAEGQQESPCACAAAAASAPGEDPAAAAAAADVGSQQQLQEQEQTAQLEPADFIDLVLGHRSLAEDDSSSDCCCCCCCFQPMSIIVGWQLLAATGDATVSLQQLEELQKSRRQQLTADLKRVWAAVIAEFGRGGEARVWRIKGSCVEDFAARGIDRRSWRDVPSAVARRQHRAGGGEAVSYTEKATTRMQCRRLVRFIRVAEYMFDAAMIDFARAGTKRLTECLALFENAAKEGAGVEQQQQQQKQKQQQKQQQRRLQQGVRKGVDARGRAGGAGASAALQMSLDKAVLMVQMELSKNGVSISPSKYDFKPYS
ncbi:hypothetical protein Emag_006536 [Eimeria magna]